MCDTVGGCSNYVTNAACTSALQVLQESLLRVVFNVLIEVSRLDNSNPIKSSSNCY